MYFFLAFSAPSVCEPNPCLNGGNCSDTGNNTFNCTCPPGIGGVNCTEGMYRHIYSKANLQSPVSRWFATVTPFRLLSKTSVLRRCLISHNINVARTNMKRPWIYKSFIHLESLEMVNLAFFFFFLEMSLNM